MGSIFLVPSPVGGPAGVPSRTQSRSKFGPVGPGYYPGRVAIWADSLIAGFIEAGGSRRGRGLVGGDRVELYDSGSWHGNALTRSFGDRL